MKNRILYVALTMCTLPAHASFDGRVVEALYLHPDIGSVAVGGIVPSQAVVGPGVEFNAGPGYNGLDVSATNILWTNILGSLITFSPDSFNGHQLRDLNNTIPDITGVSVNPATNLPGFNAGLISYDANSIQVNFSGMLWDVSHVVSLDVTFAAAPPVAATRPIPTVSTLGLGLLASLVGLFGIFAARRRNRA